MFRQPAKGTLVRWPYDRAMNPNLQELDTGERSPATAHTAMLEALVAGEGLEAVAGIVGEHAGAPVGIYVPRPGTDGSDGTAAERYVAELVAGGDPRRPEEATDVVPIFCEGELQGAVVMLAEGGPEAGEYLRVAAVAALTGIAMLNARDETARSLGASFLAELMARRDGRVDDVLRRAGLLGRDLSEGLVGLCAEPRDCAPSELVATLAADSPEGLVEAVGARVYALLPGGPEAAHRAADRLGTRATVGVSSHYRRPGDARVALDEAELLVDVGATVAASHTFRLLFRFSQSHPEELRRFGEEVVGPVVRHDHRHASELMVTLCAYLEHNCNMNLTARTTYTHRHTVSNRLTRVEELTGLDPLESEDRELLGLAIKAHRLAEVRP
jgi:hypothetical protein